MDIAADAWHYRGQIPNASLGVHAASECDEFFHRSQGAPESVLELGVLRAGQALFAVAVTHMALVAHKPALLDLPQCAAAIGAGKRRRWSVDGAGSKRVDRRMLRSRDARARIGLLPFGTRL